MEKRESLTPSASISDEGEPSSLEEDPQEIQPRLWFRFSSILLGLLPLLVLSSAYLLIIHEGRCQPHTGSTLLALLSIILWGAEMTVGLFCLFNPRIRSLANTLLLTLILSVFPGGLVIYLGFLAAFCLHVIF